MDEHSIKGWLCGDCGALVPVNGVIPAIRVLTGPAGTPLPSLILEAADGHGEVVTLGWANLRILAKQLLVARCQDPEDGVDVLLGLADATRLGVLAALAEEAQGSREAGGARP